MAHVDVGGSLDTGDPTSEEELLRAVKSLEDTVAVIEDQDIVMDNEVIAEMVVDKGVAMSSEINPNKRVRSSSSEGDEFYRLISFNKDSADNTVSPVVIPKNPGINKVRSENSSAEQPSNSSQTSGLVKDNGLDKAARPVYLYSSVDKGPFTVFVEKIQDNLGSRMYIDPIVLGKGLLSTDIAIRDNIKKIGRNRCAISLRTYKVANDLVIKQSLAYKGYRTFIPGHLVQRQGIVRGIDTSITDSEMLEDFQAPRKILSVRRLNRKTYVEGTPITVPTRSVVITFQGQSIPDKIFIYHNAIEVLPYIYNVIYCNVCLRFGHTFHQCRSKPRCSKCAEEHSATSCRVEQVSFKCVHCDGNHQATDRSCKEWARQKSIKERMAFENMTFQEAAGTIPRLDSPALHAGGVHLNRVREEGLKNISARAYQGIGEASIALQTPSSDSKSYAQATKQARRRTVNYSDSDEQGHLATPRLRTRNSCNGPLDRIIPQSSMSYKPQGPWIAPINRPEWEINSGSSANTLDEIEERDIVVQLKDLVLNIFKNSKLSNKKPSNNDIEIFINCLLHREGGVCF